MQSVINTILRTILRAGVYKGMRRVGIAPTIVLAVISAVILVITGRH